MQVLPIRCLIKSFCRDPETGFKVVLYTHVALMSKRMSVEKLAVVYLSGELRCPGLLAKTC